MSTDPSTPPYQPPPTGPTALPVQQTNAAGLAGFIISLCGFITCVCFPIGMIVSLVGLKSEPKGLAIAGTVIGAIGTVLIVIIIAIYGVAIAACIGIGVATQQVIKQEIETDDAISEAKLRIDDFETDNDRLPDEMEGNDLISDLTDGWGNALRYEPLDGDYEIRSPGSDGQFDTEDDRTTEDAFSFDVDDYDSGVDDYDSGVDATPDDSSDVSDDVPEDPDDAPEDSDDL